MELLRVGRPSHIAMLEYRSLPMDDNERKYWVAFTRIPRVGTVRVREMERHFGALSKAWAADSEELGRAGLDRRTAQNVVTRRPDINPDAEIGEARGPSGAGPHLARPRVPGAAKRDPRPASGALRPRATVA